MVGITNMEAFAAVACALYFARWSKCNPRPRPVRSIFMLPHELPTALRPFAVGQKALRRLMTEFLSEMQRGLDGVPGSTMQMIPSFVTQLPTGLEKGTFWALDLGGSNFRVVKVPLSSSKGGFGTMRDHKVQLPQSALSGSQSDLFGFIAREIKKEGVQSGDVLAFTFSFPVDQTGIASGTLLEWTKGFSTTGVVGKDVAVLLAAALEREGLHVSVSALVNDTVGTLMAAAYSKSDARVGVILGTGNNACYLERLDRIGKWAGQKDDPDALMVVNMEWGGFGSDPNRGQGLPLTAADDEIDAASPNKGRQRFEKTISGLYLGELARLAMRELAHSVDISDGFTSDFRRDNKSAFWELDPNLTNRAFETRQAARMESDNSSDLRIVRSVLQEHGVDCTHAALRDLKLAKLACTVVSTRAAVLCAAAIACVVQKMQASGVPLNRGSQGRNSLCTIGIDGSVFEKYPRFEQRLEATLSKLRCHCSLLLAQDGSGKGAALVAATMT